MTGLNISFYLSVAETDKGRVGSSSEEGEGRTGGEGQREERQRGDSSHYTC